MVKNNFEILAKTTRLGLLFTETETIGEVVWEGNVLGFGHDVCRSIFWLEIDFLVGDWKGYLGQNKLEFRGIICTGHLHLEISSS